MVTAEHGLLAKPWRGYTQGAVNTVASRYGHAAAVVPPPVLVLVDRLVQRRAAYYCRSEIYESVPPLLQLRRGNFVSVLVGKVRGSSSPPNVIAKCLSGAEADAFVATPTRISSLSQKKHARGKNEAVSSETFRFVPARVFFPHNTAKRKKCIRFPRARAHSRPSLPAVHSNGRFPCAHDMYHFSMRYLID